ncbi:MAG: FkbM family methyltransferase [bacterium]|nr:FkbM family methyltransferase [bacterium]
MSTAFAGYVAGSLQSERFTFIDIGCSGGIDPVWRIFGDRLRVLAFDASIDECKRLTSIETHPDINYVAGFVGISPDHPFAKRAGDKPRYERNPFARFCAGRMLQINRKRLESSPLEEKLRHNAWGMTKLADPEKPVIVPSLLHEMGWSDVDFLKIDIDGPDFDVINSFDGYFNPLKLVAARLEVNLYGGVDDTHHTFHNMDRFMRARGFELAGLDVRTYAMSAMPSPFAITAPAQNITGRPYQAEAFYMRDPAAPEQTDAAIALGPEKLAKLAAILSVWDQPDGAAEILIKHRKELRDVLDVDLGLELLAGQAQAGPEPALPYGDYIAAFEAGEPRFYPPPNK